MAGDNLGVARGSIQINTSELKNADLALRSAGGSMVDFGMKAIGAFATIVNEAAKFEREMDYVSAVTAASTDQMDKLNQKAIEMAKSSIYGPIEMAQAFVEMGKAGATVEQILGGVAEAAVQLAQAADIEIPFAGESLLNIMNTFQIQAAEATAVVDNLAGAANASSIDVMDMVYSLKYAGPVANALGIDLYSVNDALTILGKRSIAGSQAGTTLRMMMLRLGGDTAPARKAMEELGIITEDGANKFFTAEGKAKSLAEVMEILRVSMDGMTDKKKLSLMNDLFGQRAVTGAMVLMEEGAEGFAAIREEIERTTAADVAAERIDNLSGSIERLKATWSAMMVEAGNPFQEALKGWVDGIREFLLFIDRLPGPVKTFLVGLVGAIGVLSLFAGAFLLTIGNIVRMVRVMAEIGNAFRVFSGGAKAAAAANKALGASFLLNPMFLLVAVIAAIIAALVLLYFHFKPFRDFIDGLWQDIQKVWDAILGFFEGLPKRFSDAWDSVTKAFSGALDTITETASGVWEAIEDGLGRAVIFLRKLPGRIAGFFTSLPGIVAGAIGQLIEILQRFLFQQLPGMLGFAIGFIIGFWIRLGILFISTTLGFLGDVLRFFVEWVPRIVGAVTRAAVGLVTAWFNFLMDLPQNTWNILMDILQAVIEWGPQIVAEGGSIAWGFVTEVISFLLQLPGMIWGILMDILGAMGQFAGQAFSAATNIGQNILNGIFNIVTGLPGLMWDILWGIIGGLENLAGNAWRAARSFGEGIWNGFASGLGIRSPSYIEEALFAIDDQVDITTKNLAAQVRNMQHMSRTIPDLNTGVIDVTPAAQVAMAELNLAALEKPSGEEETGNTVFNAPLIGEAYIRNEQDALTMARELDRLSRKQSRARGQRVTGVVGIS